MTKDEYLMGIAEAVASAATCPDLKVGCVIVTEDNHILSTGYNGTPHGEKHCRVENDVCQENGPDHRVVHAEQNAIAQAAKEGVRLRGATLYVTYAPCNKCRALIKQAGIAKIVTKTFKPGVFSTSAP